jgi:hypothetical protein
MKNNFLMEDVYKIFKLSRRRALTWPSSGLLRHVVWYKFTDVSEVLAASIIHAVTHCDVGKILVDHTEQHFRRQSSSFSPL